MKPKSIKSRALEDLTLRNADISKGKEQNLLAIDFGEKFCGLAFSPDGVVVLPMKVVKNENWEKEVIELLNKKCVQKIIIGLPLSSDGTQTDWCRRIRKETEFLREFTKIEWINERFSSKNISALSNKKRTDDLAAAQILEFYLAKK